MSDSPEQINNDQVPVVDASQSATEQVKKLDEKTEASAELSPRDIEAQAERARVEAIRKATEAKAANKDLKKSKEHSNSVKRGLINKKQRDDSFKKTINRVQSELPTTSRVFSKIIHNRFVEETSDIISKTIMRPDAVLFGSIFAFILTLATYTVSKTVGYNLSGSETIVAFIIGWLLGIIYDYLRVMITGKKS